ncbi:type II/IV secretion system protein [Candidatus Uhrbacteria bacterium]|nr:type II/IV secretion system protein [Candidatus Uhrbacteria bacterium]
MLDEKTLREAIKETKLLPATVLRKATIAAREKKEALDEYLTGTGIITEDKLYAAVAQTFNLPFLDISKQQVRKDILFVIPEALAEAHFIVPFEKSETEIKLATTNPQNIQTVEFIKRKTGLAPKVYITTPAAISEILKQYRRSLKAEFEEISIVATEEEPEKLRQLAEDLPIIRIVDSLIEHAIFERASDIHIEPGEKEVYVRYRIDGILRNVSTFPKIVHPGIIARIKILSNLQLDEHRLPQDGRIRIITTEYKYSLRISIFPTFEGEKVVMRLLPEQAKVVSLEELGLEPKPLSTVKRNIKRPHGLILVTGPTGSGKTTTLYSVINILNTPEVNISTVEDPIEYRMPGVNQAQVNSKIGFTFASGLRALLRQDPNIIMVGEIRDQETADIALNAALTGHLVLSTLHTNDAVTALPRLTDLGIQPFLVAFTTNLIIAQRLVRKLCQSCKQEHKLEELERTELSMLFDMEKVVKTLIREEVVPKTANPKNLTFYKPTDGGCANCNKSGYKGRLGIYEVLEITHGIAQLFNRSANADELRKAAILENMVLLHEDGFTKAVKGITSLSEVIRVTKE